MKFGILVFPGSNCDRDCHHVLTRAVGVEADYVWHRDTSVDGFDGIVIPGGFSYGDYLRAGAVARISPVMEAVREFASKGGPVIGICNGFQILLECGMLPGAMLRNDTLRFVCKPVHMRVVTSRTPFSRRFDIGDVVSFPIANAEGNYFIDEAGYRQLRDEDRIVFEYSDPNGEVTRAANPNGSAYNIAGVCNDAGNVLGVMPHPERASEAILGGTDGLRVFEGAVDFVAGGGR